MPALWRCRNDFNSALHEIDPNSEYISANEPKPNPVDTYRPNKVFCKKTFFMNVNVRYKFSQFIECTRLNYTIITYYIC